MADISYNYSPRDIIPTDHASNQMRKRRISRDYINLVLTYGEHLEGEYEGTREACIEIDGIPITVVYDKLAHKSEDVFRIITVIKKRCRE